MDRRQKKTREAIFSAFEKLLSKKSYDRITVGEIIECADVGRTTFYAHFETKDYLLKELCKELFCHIFDSTGKGRSDHKHIFKCDAPSSVFLHLLQHLQRNDHNILDLLSCESNAVFLRYFKENLIRLVKDQMSVFEDRFSPELPRDFCINHISATFVETVRWWIENGMRESTEELTDYFMEIV